MPIDPDRRWPARSKARRAGRRAGQAERAEEFERAEESEGPAALSAARSEAERAQESRDLQKLIDEGGLSGYTGVDATVIFRSPKVWYSTIRINAGSSATASRSTTWSSPRTA